jgi:hypothetical protein
MGTAMFGGMAAVDANVMPIDDVTPGGSLVEDGARMTASNQAEAMAVGGDVTSYVV